MEIAIVLVIFGLLASMTLPVFLAQQQRQKNYVSREHQERILYALGVYFQLHGCLPCPADPSAKKSSWGEARDTCQGSMAQGIVPFRDLGLSETVAKDGHRRFFTYAVHPQLADLGDRFSKGGSSYFKKGLDKKEFIVTEAGAVIPDKEGQDPIALVLISHGSSGKKKENASACKKENINGDMTFCARPAKDDTGLFDDIVRWETRFNFPSYYAKIMPDLTDPKKK